MFVKSTNNCDCDNVDYGTISVFICSILLSLGGFISIIASSCRRSRCTELGCCGSSCTRVPVDDVEPGI